MSKIVVLKSDSIGLWKGKVSENVVLVVLLQSPECLWMVRATRCNCSWMADESKISYQKRKSASASHYQWFSWKARPHARARSAAPWRPTASQSVRARLRFSGGTWRLQPTLLRKKPTPPTAMSPPPQKPPYRPPPLLPGWYCEYRKFYLKTTGPCRSLQKRCWLL